MVFRNLIPAALVILICSCTSLSERIRAEDRRRHPEFTIENAMKVKAGMSPEEIVKLFGYPDKVSARTVGTETEDPWNAMEYTYRMGGYNRENWFLFSIEYNTLQHWAIGVTVK